VLAKVAEYLNAGVAAVGVLDPDRGAVQLFEADQPVRILSGDDELALTAILPGFGVPVRRFFE
jgi:Uma2 family endonuclease